MDLAIKLMFNLSLLLVLLFFFIIFVEQKVADFSRSFYFFYFSISLILCLLVSNTITDYLIFDLRQIPLTLGGLYMGPILGSWLFLLTIVMRGWIAIDTGFWISSFYFLGLTITTILLHKKFLIKNRHTKVIWATTLAIITSIFWGAIYWVENLNLFSFSSIVLILIIPVLGTTIIIYTIESVREKLVYRTRVLNSEKREAVSHISASIAHEVRNPLTVTRGFLQLLQRPLITDENRLDYTSIAIKELDRAESIIADYLTFSKPTLTKNETLVVCEVLKQMVEVIKPLANMNTVELELECDCKATICGDKNNFHQSILNMFKNCIEAMPNGGKLTINTYIKNKQLIIEIKDTGIGMTKEQLQRLGEPYFSNKGIKGTGLGMMVTYSVVRTMNGFINVESEINKGTTFKLRFPLAIEDNKNDKVQGESNASSFDPF